ncbi:MAG: hypothetical protein VB042_09895 [Victivallaceae bacterium]|nr:hypothetical protein [Victivallaceae bacterium]
MDADAGLVVFAEIWRFPSQTTLDDTYSIFVYAISYHRNTGFSNLPSIFYLCLWSGSQTAPNFYRKYRERSMRNTRFSPGSIQLFTLVPAEQDCYVFIDVQSPA